MDTNLNQLSISIPRYEEKDKNTIYYIIDVCHNKTQQKWTVEKRFKEFEELHKILMIKFPAMPFLPPKSLFKVQGEALNKRKMDLEKYLNVLILRKDAFHDKDFRKFLELDRAIKNEAITKTKKIAEISNLPMPVKDILYIKENGVLFILLCDTSVLSKMDSLLSSFSNPMGKDKRELGAIIAYKEEPIGSGEFNRLWKKGFEYEPTRFYWDQDLTLLGVGFKNGTVHILRVSSESGYNKYDDFVIIKRHTDSVNGLGLFAHSGCLISVSSDKYIVKSDLAKLENYNEIEKLHLNALTAMEVDKERKRFFVTDATGTLFIYSSEDHMNLLGSIQDALKSHIEFLFFENKKKYLFGGSKQGWIIIYEIRKSGEERFSSIVGTIESAKNIKSLSYSSRKELYVTNNTGNVTFTSVDNGNSFYILEGHNEEISKIIYLEDRNLMITGSKDKKVKFWKYPLDDEFKPNPEYIDTRKSITKASSSTSNEKSIKIDNNEKKSIEESKENKKSLNDLNNEEEEELDNGLGGWDK